MVNDKSEYALAGSRAINILCQKYLKQQYPITDNTDIDFMYIGPRPYLGDNIDCLDPSDECGGFRQSTDYFLNKYGLSENINGTDVVIPELLFLGCLIRIQKAKSPKILEDIYKIICLKSILKKKKRYSQFVKLVAPEIKNFNICFDFNDYYLNRMAYFADKDVIFVGQCAYKLLCLHYLNKTVKINQLTLFTSSDNEYTNTYWGGSKIQTILTDSPNYIIIRGIKVLDPRIHYSLYKKLLSKSQLTALNKILEYEKNSNS